MLAQQQKPHAPYRHHPLQGARCAHPSCHGTVSTGTSEGEGSEEALVEAMEEHCGKPFTGSRDIQKHLEVSSKTNKAVHQSLESLAEGHRALTLETAA